MHSAHKYLAAVAAAALALCAAYLVGSNRAVPPASALPQPSLRQAGLGASLVDPYVAGPVKNTLRKQAAAMQQLWLTYLEKPQAQEAGSIEIDWRIDGKGNPLHVGVVSSTLNDKALEEGLVRTIAGLNFPAPDVPEKYVVHKFNFKKEDLVK